MKIIWENQGKSWFTGRMKRISVIDSKTDKKKEMKKQIANKFNNLDKMSKFFENTAFQD